MQCLYSYTQTLLQALRKKAEEDGCEVIIVSAQVSFCPACGADCLHTWQPVFEGLDLCSATPSLVVLPCKALQCSELVPPAVTCQVHALCTKELNHAAGGGRVARSGAC